MAYAKKKQIKHQLLYQNVTPKFFFHRRNDVAPFCMKIVKHVCDTNTNIYEKFQIFLKYYFLIFLGKLFFDFIIHVGACAPESQNASSQKYLCV